MELQKIWVSLAMKADEYTKGIDQAVKKADGFAKNLTGKLGGAFESLKGIATGAMLGVAGAIAGGVAAIGMAAFDVSQQTHNAALDMQAQFGMTADEAERTAQLARDAWADNLGESIGDVSTVMGSIIQQLGEFGATSDEEITKATQSAIRLRDTFEVDTSMSIDAARVLMERFGLTSEQAFDMMTTGLQSGLSANGDFLESITEYAPVFADAGFSAGEMYRIMETGAASGVLGTDKISDAIKEMGIRLNEGGDATKKAFDDIGLSYDDISEKVRSGETTWAEQFSRIVGSINSIEDPLLRQQAQVGIFGTMAEDLGPSFTEGLSTAGSALTAFEGATDSLNAKYENFGSLWEGTKRTVIDAVAPITDRLLEWANSIMPQVQEAIGTFTEKLTAVVDIFGNFFSRMENGVPVVSNLIAFIAQLTGVLGMPTEQASALIMWLNRLANDTIPSLQEKITTITQPIMSAIVQFVSFKDILAALGVVLLATVIPAVVSLAVSMAPIILVVTAVIGIIALLRNAWEKDWGGIQAKTRAVIDFVNDKIEALRRWWDEHGEAILAKAEEVWSAIQSAVETAINIITSVVDAFRSAFEGDWRGFGENLRQAWDQVWSLITGAVENFKTWFTSIDWIQLGKDILLGLGEGITSLQSWVAEQMTAIGQALLDAIKGFFGIESPSTLMAEQGVNIIQGLIDGVLDLGNKIWIKTKTIFTDWWGDITKWWGETNWKQLGLDIVSGVLKGLRETGQNIIDTITGFANDAIAAAKRILGIESPSTVFHEIGVNMAQGLINGIRSLTGPLIDETTRQAQAITNYFTEVVREGDHINGWLQELPEKWFNVIVGLAKQIEGGGEALKSYFATVIAEGDYLNEYLEDLPDSIRPSVEEIGRIIASVTDEAERQLLVLGALLDTASSFGNLASGFANIFTQRTLDPIEANIAGTNDQLDDLFERLQRINRGSVEFVEGFEDMPVAHRIREVQRMMRELEALPFMSSNQRAAYRLLQDMEGQLGFAMSYGQIIDQHAGELEGIFDTISGEIHGKHVGRFRELFWQLEDADSKEQLRILDELERLFRGEVSLGRDEFIPGSQIGLRAVQRARELIGWIDTFESRASNTEQTISDLMTSITDLEASGVVQLPEDFNKMTTPEQIKVIEELIKQFDDLSDFGSITSDQLAALSTLRGIHGLLEDRNRLEREYADEQERILRLQQAQQDLQFLQQQYELLKLIRDNNLSTALLDGLEFGLSADPGKLADAMVAAMRQMIKAAEDELGIASPSRWGIEFGQNVIAGIARGLERAKAIEQSLTKSLQRGFAPAASYGVALAPAAGGRTDIRINGGYNVYVSGLMDDPLEAIEVQRR